MSKHFPDTINELFIHNEVKELKTWIYLTKPCKINSMERLSDIDRRTVEELERLTEYTELLNQYRIALFERAKVISSAVYSPVLKFWRRKSYYDKKVTFHITISQRATIPGIAEQIKLKENFTGKERAKAFTRFKELKKLHPNIQIEQDCHWVSIWR